MVAFQTAELENAWRQGCKARRKMLNASITAQKKGKPPKSLPSSKNQLKKYGAGGITSGTLMLCSPRVIASAPT
jgi:hypothetical protein